MHTARAPIELAPTVNNQLNRHPRHRVVHVDLGKRDGNVSSLNNLRVYASDPIPASAYEAVTDNLASKSFLLHLSKVGGTQSQEVPLVSSMFDSPNARLGVLAKALAASRARASWNARLAHWERPASDSEEAQIQRAARMVRNAISSNVWLSAELVTIEPQGSYHNNTNVRQEADMDLRAMHPLIRAECGPGVIEEDAYRSADLIASPRSLRSVADDIRAELSNSLVRAFGKASVTVGTKAIRIDKRIGCRADVDIVPAFGYRWITRNVATRRISVAEGIAILGIDGSWTYNFPAQHTSNGIDKRTRTKLRFKKVVRSLKRLRDELVELEIIDKKRAPSFLIECLAYWAGDDCYLNDADDRYERLLRVLKRLETLLNDPDHFITVTEINHIKWLFHETQPWTATDALTFVLTAKTRLES